MSSRDSWNKGFTCVVLLVFTFGCTTIRPLTITNPQELVELVAVGDKIEIEKKDGNSAKLNVTEVSKEGIRGNDIFVAYGDIKQVLVSRENSVGTGLLVISGIVVLYALEKNSDCGIFTFIWDSECEN